MISSYHLSPDPKVRARNHKKCIMRFVPFGLHTGLLHTFPAYVASVPLSSIWVINYSALNIHSVRWKWSTWCYTAEMLKCDLHFRNLKTDWLEINAEKMYLLHKWLIPKWVYYRYTGRSWNDIVKFDKRKWKENFYKRISLVF